MGASKRYDGYRSFQYLEAPADYHPFDLVKEIGRVPSVQVAASQAEEARVQDLLARNLVVSMHDHPVVAPEDISQIFEQKRRGRDFTGFEGLAASGLDCVFDNLMDGICTITSQAGWKWNDILHDLGMRLCDLAHQDFVLVCDGVRDVERAHREGRVALVPTLEAATPIENEVDRVDVLYGFGVRSMGIVYSEANALGCGLREAQDGGLTDLGRAVVRRMNKLGMQIDAAHCGDCTTLDIIETSEHPIVISHAGCRSLWPTRRMKLDHVLEAMARKGGVLGIEAAPHTTLTERHPLPMSFTDFDRGNPVREQTAVVSRQYWRDVGADVELRVSEFNALLSRIRTRPNPLQSWVLWYITPPEADLVGYYHSQGTLNEFGYANAEVDQLLEKGRATFDLRERAGLYQQAQKLMAADAPVVFMVYPAEIQALARRVQGRVPMGYRDALTHMVAVSVTR